MAEHIIGENDSNRRVDRLLRHFIGNVPLSLIYSSIRKGLVKLNGKKTKAENKTSLGDVLYIDESLEALKKDKIQVLKKHNLNVILKTEDLLFLNKEKGNITHGKDSIDEKVKESSFHNSSLSFTVGALHRLDKNTTGVLTFSQSLKGATLFSKNLLEGNIERYYIGVNEGKLKSGFWKLSSNKFDERNKISVDNPTYFLHSICLHFIKPIFEDVPSFILASFPNDFLNVIKMYFPKSNKDLSKNGIESITKIWIKNI